MFPASPAKVVIKIGYIDNTLKYSNFGSSTSYCFCYSVVFLIWLSSVAEAVPWMLSFDIDIWVYLFWLSSSFNSLNESPIIGTKTIDRVPNVMKGAV